MKRQLYVDRKDIEGEIGRELSDEEWGMIKGRMDAYLASDPEFLDIEEKLSKLVEMSIKYGLKEGKRVKSRKVG